VPVRTRQGHEGLKKGAKSNDQEGNMVPRGEAEASTGTHGASTPTGRELSSKTLFINSARGG